MRKLYILLALVVFCGCVEVETPIEKQKRIEKSINSELYRVDFEGHTYIFRGNVGGMVHDPDCECRKN